MPTIKEFKYNIDKFNFRSKDDSEEQANRIMFFVIQRVLKDDLECFERLYAITRFLEEVTDKDVFLNTINLFSEINFSELKETIHSKVNTENNIYSESQIIRIYAIIFANYIRYYAMKTKYDTDFSFKIKGNKIRISAIDSLSNFKRKLVLTASTNFFKNDTKEYDKLIGVMSKVDYERGTKYFKEEIEFLKNESNRVSATNTVDRENNDKNPYPRIFVSFYAFQVFDQYSNTIGKKHQLADYSFLFRKMIEDNLIFESIGDSEFRLWLSTNYQIEIDKTKRLYQCTTFIKENLYSTIKDSVKQ